MNKIGAWLRDNRPALLPTIPLVFYWLYWANHPGYWFSTDPAAWYFLDSLAPFKGKPYLYVDHPGTPVHLIGTFLIGLTYPLFGNSQKLISYFIAEPETFFVMANGFLLAMNLLTVFLLYRTVAKTLQKDQLLASLGIGLMYFAIHPQGFSSLVYWSHNSFNFIFGTLWLLWLYREAQTGDISRKKGFVFGLAAGALVTTQLYLLPWLAGGAATVFFLALFREKSLRSAFLDGLVFGAGGILGIALLLLPAYQALPRLLNWFTRLVGSQGVYGTGEAGFYSLQLLPLSLGFWSEHAPALMTALVLSLSLAVVSLWKARRDGLALSSADLALALGLTVQALLLIFVLSKFFYRLRYLLSLAALLPILALLALKLAEQARLRIDWLKRLALAGLLFSMAAFVGQEITSQRKKALDEREAAISRSQVVSILTKQKGVGENDLVIVYAFSTPIKCAGLLTANNWIRAFDDEIAALCPNQYAIYDFKFDYELNTPHPIPQIEQIPWDVVVWPSNGSNLPDYLDSVGARTVPGSWGISRAGWFFIRP
ncbi:MAG: hypothetical protein Fur0016_08870 [Anaerolineales bacterium]